jgi:[ribosomal protein S5]-alanine N-acetyltransferase
MKSRDGRGAGGLIAGMVELRTRRLRLRRARAGDLDALHAVFSHPAAMRYWSSLPDTELAQTRERLEEMLAASPEDSDDFVVEYQGHVIGKAGCWRIPEVGFILHPDYWGRGLASEALAAVIERAFATFPIDALEAEADPRNTGSLAVLGRLGFREVRRAERTWKIGDEWSDSIYLNLPRPA